MLPSGDQKPFASRPRATSSVTPSDCWIRQSFSRSRDGLTCAAELLTLTGLELHTAAECCNVQADDGNPYQCVCASVGRERGLVCHTTSAPSAALLLYLPFGRGGGQQFAANEQSRSEASERACGSRKNKVWQSQETNFVRFSLEI